RWARPRGVPLTIRAARWSALTWWNGWLKQRRPSTRCVWILTTVPTGPWWTATAGCTARTVWTGWRSSPLRAGPWPCGVQCPPPTSPCCLTADSARSRRSGCPCGGALPTWCTWRAPTAHTASDRRPAGQPRAVAAAPRRMGARITAVRPPHRPHRSACGLRRRWAVALQIGDLAAHFVHVEVAGLLDQLLQGRFRQRARLGVEHSPIPHDHERRNRLDVEARGQLLLGLGVDLGEHQVLVPF